MNKMNSNDITLVRNLLVQEGYTCVMGKGEFVYTSRERGVKPLLELLAHPGSLPGYVAADKVVGKAAAFLYCLLKVDYVYSDVISKPALEVFEAHGITAEYGELADAIRNRAGDGFCPMETTVLPIDSPEEALVAIRKKVAELRQISS